MNKTLNEIALILKAPMPPLIGVFKLIYGGLLILPLLGGESKSFAKPSTTPSSVTIAVPLPKVLPDQKGLEAQQSQSASFLKWIDPKRVTKSASLQLSFPRFTDQVHYLVDENSFTHIARASILRIPTEGKAKLFFKSHQEIKGKNYISSEKFVQAHQNQFEKIEAEEGRAPSPLPEPNEKILLLYSFGKITIPQSLPNK